MGRCENVAGHIGLGFDAVAASLEAENFTVWPFVIPASAVNAPHRRDRIWIIAHANGANAGTTGDRHPASLEGRAALQAPRQGGTGRQFSIADSVRSARMKYTALWS